MVMRYAASFPPAKQRVPKGNDTSKVEYAVNPAGSLSQQSIAELSALDNLDDAGAESRAGEDRDNHEATEEQLAAMRRLSPVRALRKRLGLSQQGFAEAYGIPVGTLRDWEQGRTRPDAASLSYLQVIGSGPETIRELLRRQ